MSRWKRRLLCRIFGHKRIQKYLLDSGLVVPSPRLKDWGRLIDVCARCKEYL